MRMPALRSLLAHAAPAGTAAGGFWGWLCTELGIARQQDWPVAPIWARAEGIDPGTAYWLVADPVTLEVGRDNVRLAGIAPTLDAGESAALVDTLNAHFSTDGLAFFAPRPERWIARVAMPPALVTSPPDAARGRALRAFLPTGGDSPRWRRWQNEMQMLLFEHPVNQAREARDAAPVNGVWCWGGGTMPAANSAPNLRIFTDDADVRQLATFAGATAAPIAAFAAFAAAKFSAASPTIALASRDQPPESLEAWLAAPAWRAMATGNVDGLALVVSGGNDALLLDCRRPSWWRRLAGDVRSPELDELIQRCRPDSGDEG